MIINIVIVLLLRKVLIVGAFQLPKIKFVGSTSNKEVDNIPKREIEQGEAEKLRRSLETHCGLAQEKSSFDYGNVRISSLYWDPTLQESYEVANAIFQEILQVARGRYHGADAGCRDNSISRVISCPSMSRPNDLKSIAEVLQSDKCKLLLGLDDASAELYPNSPAPYIRLTFSGCAIEHWKNDKKDAEKVQTSFKSDAISSTENWVNSFLGKYNLCPYTLSVAKAAVGLTSVDVPAGKVHVVVGCTTELDASARNTKDYNILRAAELLNSFWSETITLLQSSETDWATSLVVFPEFDNSFESFFDVCDNIVQPIIEATSSHHFIGRAWFHPNYDADIVGHTSVIAGHAVPHIMVKQFIQTINGSESIHKNRITNSELSDANNKVRMSPHATINILRRSQLNAAAQYEKELGEKKPKPNSIYVKNTMKLINMKRNRGKT